jgi:hypothetical protein
LVKRRSTGLSIPEDLDDLLTPSWLTAALGPRYGVTVRSITPGPVVARVCTNARFRIECDDALPHELPADLCAKGFFGDLMKGHRQAGEPEARFYDELAPSLDVRTLRSVYAGVDPDTRHGVVISEDVIAQGATFLDATDEYTPDHAAQSLDELANLHIATWGAENLTKVPWLAPRLGRQLEARGVNEIRHNFEGPIGARVPDDVRDAERLVTVYCAVIDETQSPSPWCVIHGDPHINNIYMDGDGHPGIVDWQLVQRGPWYLDVGYHVASALTVEDRRSTERDLVQHYLDRLTAAGIAVPDSDDVWAGLRRGIIHGLFLWGITMMVDPAITTIMLERLGTAAADHGALDAV